MPISLIISSIYGRSFAKMGTENQTKQVRASPEREKYLKQMHRQSIAIKAWRIGIITLLLLLWELLTWANIWDEFLISRPSSIVITIWNMAQNGLFVHIGTTLYETLTGFLIGVFLGLLISTLLWSSSMASKIAEPYLVVLNALPKIALGPVIILIAGAGTQAIIVMAVAISLIVTVMEMLTGFRAVDKDNIKMAQTFGANKRQIFTKIVLPANMPVLFNSLKVNIGLSLVGVIAGEFLVSKAGLGYLIVYGGQVFQMDLVMASVFILALLAALMYKAVAFAQKRIAKHYSGK